MQTNPIKRFLVNSAASYLAVFLLVLMSTAPALAALTANTVNSAAIIDGQVKTRDLGLKAVTAPKIAGRAVKAGKIALGAINSGHIQDGSIGSGDIASIADSKISYSTQTKRYSISGDSFTPALQSLTYTKAFGLLTFGGGGLGWFSAPVHLPDGAKVTAFRFNFVDNDGLEMTAVLLRRPLTSAGYENVAVAGATTGASPDMRNLNGVIEKPLVDNENYIYSAMIAFSGASSNLIAGGVVITYEISRP